MGDSRAHRRHGIVGVDQFDFNFDVKDALESPTWQPRSDSFVQAARQRAGTLFQGHVHLGSQFQWGQQDVLPKAETQAQPNSTTGFGIKSFHFTAGPTPCPPLTGKQPEQQSHQGLFGGFGRKIIAATGVRRDRTTPGNGENWPLAQNGGEEPSKRHSVLSMRSILPFQRGSFASSVGRVRESVVGGLKLGKKRKPEAEPEIEDHSEMMNVGDASGHAFANFSRPLDEQHPAERGRVKRSRMEALAALEGHPPISTEDPNYSYLRLYEQGDDFSFAFNTDPDNQGPGMGTDDQNEVEMEMDDNQHHPFFGWARGKEATYRTYLQAAEREQWPRM